ncbi:MAG: glycoside hydrolase family 18 protein [Alicyclobacillus sp.]|nr:glycoside hydrolase family 18 protein [Alicyclobacillus sp.]
MNYAFATITDGQIAFTDPWADTEQPLLGESSDPNAIKGNFGELMLLKQKYPNLKTIISVGGWGNSAAFSTVAATQASRDTFADSVVQFLKEYDFDGIDIDWEYPVAGGYVASEHNPNDKEDFTLLLQTLRQKLDSQGALDQKHYYLTVAAAANIDYATKGTDLATISQYVDWFNLMTYDIHGSWDSYTGLVAPLYTDSKDPGQWSDDAAVQLYLKEGVPANKIVMGVPFYGYDYKGVTSQTNNGLYQPYKVGSGSSIAYNKVVTNDLNQNGFIYHWDLAAMSPYLFNGNEFISFEDPASIFMKTLYVDTHNLGGVMIWELGQDYNQQLLNTIYYNLK